MDAIPAIRFFFIFIFAGLLFYMFDNVLVIYILPNFPSVQTGPYYELIRVMWDGAIPFAVMLRESIILIRSYYQRRAFP